MIGAHGKLNAVVGTAPVTAAFTSTGGSDAVMVVDVQVYGGVNINSVTDNKGNTYTQQGATVQFSGDTTLRAARFVCERPTGGAIHTITANLSGSAFCAIYYTEVLGCITSGTIVDQAPAGLSDAHSNATPYVSNTTGTTAQADECVHSCSVTYSVSGTEVHSYNNGYTLLDELTDTTTWTGASGYKDLTATGTQQSSLNATGSGATGAVTFITTLRMQSSGGGAVAFIVSVSAPPARPRTTQPQIITGFGQATPPDVAAKIVQVAPRAETVVPFQPRVLKGVVPAVAAAAAVILTSRLPPALPIIAGPMMVTGIAPPDPVLGILTTALPPALRAPVAPQLLRGVAPAAPAPAGSVLKSALAARVVPPALGTQLLAGVVPPAPVGSVLTSALAPRLPAAVSPQAFAGVAPPAVILQARLPELSKPVTAPAFFAGVPAAGSVLTAALAARVVPPALGTQLLAGVAPAVPELAGSVLTSSLPARLPATYEPTLVQGFGQPSVDPAGSVLVSRLPEVRPLPFEPQLVVGAGEATPIPAGKAFVLALPQTLRQPTAPMLIRGAGEATVIPAGAALSVSLPIVLRLPTQPALSAGVPAAGSVLMSSLPQTLRAPSPPVLIPGVEVATVVPAGSLLAVMFPPTVRLPTAPQILAGVVPPPPSPVLLHRTAPPALQLPVVQPTLLAGVTPPVPIPLGPLVTVGPPLKLPSQPQSFAGVAPPVPIPLGPLLPLVARVLVPFTPQPQLVTGFGEPTPPTPQAMPRITVVIWDERLYAVEVTNS